MVLGRGDWVVVIGSRGFVEVLCSVVDVLGFVVVLGSGGDVMGSGSNVVVISSLSLWLGWTLYVGGL